MSVFLRELQHLHCGIAQKTSLNYMFNIISSSNPWLMNPNLLTLSNQNHQVTSLTFSFNHL